MAPPPPPPMCLPFSSSRKNKNNYDADGKPRRRRDQYRSYSDGSSLTRSYTESYRDSAMGRGGYYHSHSGGRERERRRSFDGNGNEKDGLGMGMGRGETPQVYVTEVINDNERASFGEGDYIPNPDLENDNDAVPPPISKSNSAARSRGSRLSRSATAPNGSGGGGGLTPKTNSQSRTPKRSSLESGSYSPTATMTSRAEKMSVVQVGDKEEEDYQPELLSPTPQKPKKTGWRRLGLGYGWGLGKLWERQNSKNRNALNNLDAQQAQAQAQLDQIYSHNNPSAQSRRTRTRIGDPPLLYGTDSNVTIPVPGSAAPVLSNKGSSMGFQNHVVGGGGGLTRNGTMGSQMSRGSRGTDGMGGVTLAVPSPPLRNDAEANRNPLSRSATLRADPNTNTNTKSSSSKNKNKNMNRSNTQTSARPSMQSQNSQSSSATLVGSALERKIDDSGPVRERVDTGMRLAEIRALMASSANAGGSAGGGGEGLGMYVVPSEDAHGSPLYVAQSDRRREWVSGFTGSVGQAIITPTAAYVVTDARYWLQAEDELDDNWTLIRAGSSAPVLPSGVGGSGASGPGTPSVNSAGAEGYFGSASGMEMEGPDGVRDWIGFVMSQIKGPTKVGIDARLVSHSVAAYLSSLLAQSGSKLVYPPQNLVDLVWKDRPARETRPIMVHQLKFAGMRADHKLERVRNWIRERPISRPSYKRGEVKDSERNVGMFVSSLENIAWVLNLRGSDIPYIPLFHAYLFIGLDSARLFVDRAKITDDVGSHLASVGVEIDDYNAVWTFLRRKPWGPGKVIVPSQTSHAIVLMLTYLYYSLLPPSAPSPLAMFQAQKNPTEAEGLRQAYLRDGAAFVKWQAWLEDKLAKGYDITEYESMARLAEYRIQIDKAMTGGSMYKGPAYESISASGPHAALPHYSPLKDDESFINRDLPYLMDSGGQYLDGTCDTTRTIIIGQPTPEMCEAYTRVLQGHIAVDSAIFPEGTSGLQLDVLARNALWKDGLNYLHGTGHGFGSYLSVQEGPHSFTSPLPLVPGHVITNEPGYYNDGNWGMRIESALLVRRMKTKHEFGGDIWLGFERLTVVPIQTRMVRESMLTKEEIQWIKDHNRRCREKLEPLVRDDKRALKWLLRETDRAIGLAELNLPGGITIDWR